MKDLGQPPFKKNRIKWDRNLTSCPIWSWEDKVLLPLPSCSRKISASGSQMAGS